MSKMIEVPIKLSCRTCGSPVPVDNKADDKTLLTCPKCGQGFGTYGEVRKRAFAEAKKQATAAFKKAFKR